MKRLLALLLGGVSWLLVVGAIAILAGGLLRRPVLLAAVPTGSMLPALRPGDLIPVLPLWGAPPGQGDIILFRTDRDGTWVVHRIVGGSEAEGFITRGDNNPTSDPGRVAAGQIAGVLPTWKGETLRVPRLGFLRPGSDFLAHPAVAGVAIIAGTYLLLTDVGAGLRTLRLRRRGLRHPENRGRRPQVLPVYLALTAVAFSTTLLVAWNRGSVQQVRYEVVEQAPANTRAAGRVIAGLPRVERLTLHNPSPVPVLVAFGADDPHLRFQPDWALLRPGQAVEVEITLASSLLGQHQTAIRQAVHLPLLPPAYLKAAAAWNWHLPMVLTALVPALGVLLCAAADSRVWAEWHGAALGLRLRLHV